MNFAWSFPQFIVNPLSNGLPNVVTAINWVCTGTDGSVTSSSSGTANLGTPNPAEFVSYDDITQSLAAQWVSQCISMLGVEELIAVQIGQLTKPISQSQTPPF